jgi:Helix-turn-helix domain
MAINVIDWVWNNSRSKHGARLVLLAIADCANSEDGDGAWPAIKTLAKKANISVTAVHAALKALVDLGELEIIYRGGKPTANGPTNAYRVIMHSPGASPAPVTDSNPTRPVTRTDSVPRTESVRVPNQDGYGISTSADSAPVPFFDDGVRNLAQGVPILDGGGTESVPITVLEPQGQPSNNRHDPAANAAGAKQPRKPKPANADLPAHAGTVVAAYCDGAEAGNLPKPGPSLISRVGRTARLMLEAGTPIKSLVDAAYTMGSEGWDDLERQVQRDAANARPGNGHPSGGRSKARTVTTLEEMRC